jgi:hypothetical protein
MRFSGDDRGVVGYGRLGGDKSPRGGAPMILPDHDTYVPTRRVP